MAKNVTIGLFMAVALAAVLDVPRPGVSLQKGQEVAALQPRPILAADPKACPNGNCD